MPWLAPLARLIERFSDLLLAPACVLCGVEAAGSRLCADCVALLEHSGTACARCAEPLPVATPLCGKCLKRPPAFDAAWAGFIYRAPFDHLVQRLKFNDALSVGRALAPIWSAALRSRLEAHSAEMPQALIPIPLHRSRLRQRGYNQALELARELGVALQLPVLPQALLRQRATAPMPGLDLIARRRNIRGAFAVGKARLPARVALIDDVMTSGATLNEAAKTLKRAGVERVEVWVLARRP
ncbi:MAG: ComF family protein [Xanthomonadales bacterium]|nr:ComF family protein [Xanthomonadales bacterium]